MGQGQVKTWQELRDQSVAEARNNRVKAITKNQGKYLKAIETSTVTICVGPAGSGKTFMACGIAAQMLKDKRCEKIIITRPLVTCGKGVGFLPGDLDEKVAPYMRPLLEAFEEFFSPRELTKHIEDKIIEMWPLDLMRGASIKNAVVILDEAQNTEFSQLYMLLTRLGQGSRIIVTGDDTKNQTDLDHKGMNPLREVVLRFSPSCHKDISIVRLTRDDIVRHGLVRWIDERMSDPFNGEKILPETESWYRLECPSCKTKLWYEDPDDLVDQVKCYHCGAAIDLWQEDEYRPRRAAKAIEKPDPTFPEKV